MAKFVGTKILDRVASGDDIFQLENLPDGRTKLIPKPDMVLESGTRINAQLLQPIIDFLEGLKNDDGLLQDERGVVASQISLEETINNVSINSGRLDSIDTILNNHDQRISSGQSTANGAVEVNELQNSQIVNLDERVAISQSAADGAIEVNKVQDNRLYSIEILLNKHGYALEKIIEKLNELLPDGEGIYPENGEPDPDDEVESPEPEDTLPEEEV